MRPWSLQGMGTKLLALHAPVLAFPLCGGVYVHKRAEVGKKWLELHSAPGLTAPAITPFNPPTAREPTGQVLLVYIPGRLKRKRSLRKPLGRASRGQGEQPARDEGQAAGAEGQTTGSKDSQLGHPLIHGGIFIGSRQQRGHWTEGGTMAHAGIRGRPGCCGTCRAFYLPGYPSSLLVLHTSSFQKGLL